MTGLLARARDRQGPGLPARLAALLAPVPAVPQWIVSYGEMRAGHITDVRRLVVTAATYEDAAGHVAGPGRYLIRVEPAGQAVVGHTADPARVAAIARACDYGIP